MAQFTSYVQLLISQNHYEILMSENCFMLTLFGAGNSSLHHGDEGMSLCNITNAGNQR